MDKTKSFNKTPSVSALDNLEPLIGLANDNEDKLFGIFLPNLI